MPDLSFDLAELSTGSQEITTLAADAAAASRALARACESAAMSWGTDEPGQAFAGAYLDAATEALSSALTVGRQLTSIAENITRMGTVYAEGEADAEDLIKEIGP